MNMGLGPPICMRCMKMMSNYNEVPYWRCANCEKTYDYEGSLFCLTDEQLKIMDEKWGTKELENRKYWQKRMREAEKLDAEQRNLRREQSNQNKDFQI